MMAEGQKKKKKSRQNFPHAVAWIELFSLFKANRGKGKISFIKITPKTRLLLKNIGTE